uniref:Uncharacterized protein n=1 Tax=Anopheles maculatus TaxID=74869 RepID=A0A182SA19_9DIPT
MEQAADGTASGIVNQQKQLAVDMQSVFAGGNIMVAMCSSLREASTSVERESSGGVDEDVPLSRTRSSSQCVLKQLSLEGQDSDYKSLELDLDVQSASVTNMSTSYNATADTTTTIVSLLSSGSEDEEDVTTNSTTNDQEEDAGGDDTLLEGKEPEPVNKMSEPSGKRRRRKRTNTCQANATTSTVVNVNTATTTTVDAKDDEVEDEEEHGDEDDEELQPLISSNKTSSSSLSAAPTTTTTTTKKDSLTYGEGSLLSGTGNDISVSLTALPSECDEPKQSTMAAYQTVDDTAKRLTVTSVGSDGVGTNSGLSTSMIVSSNTGKLATGGITPAGGGNGGNGKKKSKKKRK